MQAPSWRRRHDAPAIYICLVKVINRTVWILSLISMFADIASEMLYPVMPVYLDAIGFPVFFIGLLEGLAACTAGLSKGYFGKRSDEKGLRIPFIRGGYGLSALSKPMLALWTFPAWIFLARFTDRLGKGMRTAARDALLSQNATPATRSRVFGFHRGLDTLGAAIGPLLALLLLSLYPSQYKLIFLLAFIPGLASFALIYLLREQKQAPGDLKKGSFFSFFRYWSIAPKAFRRLVPGLLFFALFNSADVFLLLKTKELTGSDPLTIGAYIAYNLVFALAAYPAGRLADAFGSRKVFLAGLLLFAGVYILFGLTSSTAMLFIAFIVYGCYAAATEGIAKAWITNMTGGKNTATALGFYTSCESICALLASAMAGLIWTIGGSRATFLVSAAAAAGAFCYILLAMRKEDNHA